MVCPSPLMFEMSYLCHSQDRKALLWRKISWWFALLPSCFLVQYPSSLLWQQCELPDVSSVIDGIVKPNYGGELEDSISFTADSLPSLSQTWRGHYVNIRLALSLFLCLSLSISFAYLWLCLSICNPATAYTHFLHTLSLQLKGDTNMTFLFLSLLIESPRNNLKKNTFIYLFLLTLKQFSLLIYPSLSVCLSVILCLFLSLCWVIQSIDCTRGIVTFCYRL